MMANQMRWRYGDTQPVMVPVLSATVIEIGDLLWLDEGTAKPAEYSPVMTQEDVTQEAFHDKFLGVALGASRAGDAANIRVATRGVFEFACPASKFSLGDLIGPMVKATVGSLDNQMVEGVACANLAIGRCMQAVVDQPSTRVLLEIVSTVLHGGPQTMA